MAQEQFAYGNGAENSGPAGLAKAGTADPGASLSIFADRAGLRAQLRDDAIAAGLQIVGESRLAALVTGSAGEASCPALGDFVLVDCPVVDAAALAGLSRLDLRAAQSGAQLIVSTTVATIDDVFACMDLSAPQLLVDPSRAERALALGEALARVSRGRVQELSEEDRLAMLRLTEQVGQIARRLEGLRLEGLRLDDSPPNGSSDGQTRKDEIAPSDDNLFRFNPAPGREPDAVRATQPAWHGKEAALAADGMAARDTLPDPRLIRQAIRQRQLRGRFLDPELFADPAWDMLLDLTAAAAEHVRVSVSSLCIAASVPPTTALRWIRQMTDTGLLARIDDDQDKRRAFITLTDRARSAMASYFRELGEPLAA